MTPFFLMWVLWWASIPILSAYFGTASVVLAQEHRLEGSSDPTPGEQGTVKKTLFKWLNLGILAGGLSFFLRKPLQRFLDGRSGEIKRSLEEAKSARENAERDLSAVLAKLSQLEQEVASLKVAAAAEVEAERQRILDAARGEAGLIVSSAHDEVSQLVKRAQKELREYAATIVVQLAEQKIRSGIRAENQETLFKQFVGSLEKMRESG